MSPYDMRCFDGQSQCQDLPLRGTAKSFCEAVTMRPVFFNRTHPE